jgi:outer membrane receptor protein involved in Fe transport
VFLKIFTSTSRSISKSFPVLALIFLSVTVFPPPASAQVNTASISGTVADPSGAVIASAQIEARDDATGAVHTAVSGPQGEYTFPFLPVGTYTITCSATGFTSAQHTNVTLVAAQQMKLDFALQTRSVTQNITVTAEAPLIDSVSSQDSNTLPSKTLVQLPVASLNWTNLLTQTTGAIKQTSSSSSTQNLGISLNGLPTAGFNLTVDGTNAAADPEVPIFGFYQSPNIINTVANDAIQEVSIVKGVPPATVGGVMSGGVNILTHSGANAFHGDAFERNETNALDARNYFATTTPRLTFNEFGGSLGGPIRRNQLFFFGAYEGARLSQFAVISGSVPTAYLRSIAPAIYTGELNRMPTLPQPAGDPADCYATTNPVVDPSCHTNATYQGVSATRRFDSSGVVRIDQNLSQRSEWYIRYTRNRPYQYLPTLNSTNPQVTTAHGDVYNAGFLHQFGSLSSNTRLGYNRLRLNRGQLGFYDDNEGLNFGFNTGNSEVFTKEGGVETGDQEFAMILGKHSLQFGGIVQQNNGGRTDADTTAFTYSSLSQFVNNTPSKITMYFPITPFNLYQWQFGGYVQDDYHMTPSLTLNLGFRYDYYTVIKEAHGRIYNRGVDPVLGPGFGPYRPADSLYNADYHTGFQPRLGFAWSPHGPGTVVRGGFGIMTTRRPFYGGPIEVSPTSPTQPANLNLTQAQIQQAAFAYPIPRSALQTDLASLQASGSVGTSFAGTSIDANFNNPYAMLWNLAVEQALPGRMVMDLGYVGDHGLNENFTYVDNEPSRTTGISPDPTFGTFNRYIAGDKSNYNAMEVKLRKQAQYGLMFGTNYTWAKSLSFGDANILLETSPQDLNDLRAEYGPTQYDIRDNFSGDVDWEVPFDRWYSGGNRVAKVLGQDWRTTLVVNANTGLPANITNGASVFPADRPDLLSNPYLAGYHAAGPSGVAHRYLNPASFTLPTGAHVIPLISGIQTRDGDLTRNAIRNIGQYDFDLSAAKGFNLSEGMKLDFRIDAFNVLNHTNFTGLGTSTSASTFGFFTSATARTIQLAGRLSF